MKKCVDCGIILTPESKSKHQPMIRCIKCFVVFSEKTTSFLKNLIAELHKEK